RAASLRAALPLPPAVAPVQPQPTSRSAAACGAARQRRGRRGVKSTLNFLSAFCAWSSETVERTLVQLVSLSIYTYCFIFLSLQRHFSVLTKFAYVESRLSGLKRQREV